VFGAEASDCFPGRAEHAQPVFVAEFSQRRVVEASFLEGGHDARQTGHVVDLVRDARTIQVGAEPNVVYSDAVRQVLEVFDDPRNGRCRVVASVSTQESEVEVDADDAVGFFDGVELTVGQVAQRLPDCGNLLPRMRETTHSGAARVGLAVSTHRAAC